jgi:hypothetical protein
MSFDRDRFQRFESAMTHQQFLVYFDQLKRRPSGSSMVLVTPRTGWDLRWIEEAADRLNSMRSQDSFLRIVFLADPHQTWRLFGEGEDILGQLERRRIATVHLSPWHPAAVKNWLDRPGMPFDSVDRVVEDLRTATGNWPILLQQFRGEAGKDWQTWKQAIAQLEQHDPLARPIADLLSDFGLTFSPVFDVLKVMASLKEELTVETLMAFVSEAHRPLVRRVLTWAGTLSLATEAARMWRLDPAVERVLNMEV